MITQIRAYIKDEISLQQQTSNRTSIKKQLNFNKITVPIIHQIFSIFDEKYFDKNIQKYINKNNINLTFMISTKMTASAGKVCHRKNEIKFVISSLIINSLNDTERKKIGGHICSDRIDCFIILFEHEFVHLILVISRIAQHETSHGVTFKKLIRNMFNHTNYTHQLLIKGDIIDTENQTNILKKNIKVGDIVVSKLIDNKIYRGIVIKKNPTGIRTKLIDNGKLIVLKYLGIEKIDN
jgi:hypothetical protein